MISVLSVNHLIASAKIPEIEIVATHSNTATMQYLRNRQLSLPMAQRLSLCSALFANFSVFVALWQGLANVVMRVPASVRDNFKNFLRVPSFVAYQFNLCIFSCSKTYKPLFYLDVSFRFSPGSLR